MADNILKTPIVTNLNAVANRKNEDRWRITGKSLPCHVSKIISSQIVELTFDVQGPYTLPKIQVPVATPEYVRFPIQVGDKGIAASLDYHQGDISGLGPGTATYQTRQGNLSNLRFHPVGSTKWTPVDNDALTMYGKNGAVIRDTGKKTTITLDPTKVDINVTNGKMIIETSGDVTITAQGNVNIKGAKINLN